MKYTEVGEGATYDELIEFLLRNDVDLKKFEEKSILSSHDLHYDITKKETILAIDGNTGLITQMAHRVRMVTVYEIFWLHELKRVYPKGTVDKKGLWISGSRIRGQSTIKTALREWEEEAGLCLSRNQVNEKVLADQVGPPKLRRSTVYDDIYTRETVEWVVGILKEAPSWLGQTRVVPDRRADLHLAWHRGNEFTGYLQLLTDSANSGL